MTGSDKAQVLADLAWVVQSPAFVEDAAVVAPFDQAGVDLDHLVSTLGPLPKRVGHYFERLVRYWLETCRGLDIEATGLQLADPETGRTIGELDLIFHDKEARRCHWELAVKFFLYDPARSGSHFPGPNTRDNYESKVAKLFEEQLRRPTDATGAFAERKAFVKGCLFHHPQVGAPPELPDRMPSTALTGTWVRASEIEVVAEVWTDHGARLLSKPHWFGSPGPDRSIAELVDDVHRHFAASRRTLMAAIHDDSGVERQRLCVVDDNW